MKAKSIKGRSIPEIQSALENSIADGFKPTLAIIFLSVEQDIKAITKIFDQAAMQIFGATTAGEFNDGEIGKGGIVAMLLDIKKEHFRIAFLNGGDRALSDISHRLGEEGRKHFRSAGYIIASSGIMADGDVIISGIEDGFGSDVTIYGGMAGDDLKMSETFVFTNEGLSSYCLIALILDHEKIELNGVAACGWKPIGIAKTVTGSAGKYVYTIDNEPALDLIVKYLGLQIEDLQESQGMINIGTYYPLQLEREGLPAVMRTAMWGVLKDHSILCAGNVPIGSKVRFSLPPDFDMNNAVEKECSQLRSETQQEADAVIMFSCLTRYLSLQMMISEEIENVTKVWNAPFIGFFTYGEFGKSAGEQNAFHNNTCCVVVLKEK